MTKQEIEILAGKIVLGTASRQELLLYNRVCSFLETPPVPEQNTPPPDMQELKNSMKKAIFQKTGIDKTGA